MQLSEVLQETLENTEDVFACTDGFLIMQGWEAVGEVVREWCQVILPATEFKQLEADVLQDAVGAFADECKRMRIEVDQNSYRFTRFLTERWHKYIDNEELGERLEQAASRLAVSAASDDNTEQMDLLRRNSVADILDTNPLDREWGFSDEYDYCMECLHSIQTSPDCYDWTLQAQLVDGEGYLCSECINPEEYLEAKKNEVDNCDRHLVDPGDHGWEPLIEEWHGRQEPRRFVSGLHGGQTDDPEKQRDTLNAAGIDVLFTLYPTQFYVEWILWVSEGKVREAEEVLEGSDTQQDIDPATVLKQQLQGYGAGVRKEGEAVMGSGGQVANVPQDWIGKHPTYRMDPEYWIEFKRRHDALPQPVDDDSWMRLVETLDAEFARSA